MVATLDPLLRYASSGAQATHGADIGALYKARRQPDGNWTVEGVEIFNACERSNPGSGSVDRFDEDWLKAAVQNFDERKSKRGYLPPVHLDHHTPEGVSQPFAGHIGRMWVAPNSDGVPSLFADLVDVPPEIYAKMAAKRLPFRSIEVNRPESKEVSSLALMATRVPFHKLPLLRVVDESGASRSLNFEEAEIHYGTPDPDTNARFAIVQRFADSQVAPLTEPTRAWQRFMGGGQYYDEDGFEPDDHQALMALLGQMGDEQDGGYGDEGGYDEQDGGEQYVDEGEDPGDAGGDAGMEEPPEDPGMGAGDPAAGGAPGGAPMAPAAPDPIAMIAQIQQQVQTLGEQMGVMQQMLTSINQGTAEAQIRPASPPPSVSAEPTTGAAHFEDAAVTTTQQPAKSTPKPATKQPASATAPAAPPPAKKPAGAQPSAAQPGGPVTLTGVQFAALMQRLDQQDERIKELVEFKEGIQFAQMQADVWEDVDVAVRGHVAKLAEDKFSPEQQRAAYHTVLKFLETDVNNALTGSVKFEELPGIIGSHVAEWRSMTKPDTTAPKPPPAQTGSAAPRTESAAKPDELKARAQAFLESAKTHGAVAVLQRAFNENPVLFSEEVATFDAEWKRQPKHIQALNEHNQDTYVRKRMVTLHSQPS